MLGIKFDFNNFLSSTLGEKHGVTKKELEMLMPKVDQAYKHFWRAQEIRENRLCLNMEWTRLAYQNQSSLVAIENLAKEISQRFENVLFLGIGGSYLGLKAAQDALASPYYNEFAHLRAGRPKIYFAATNLDPLPLSTLIKSLNPKKTCVVVISKSGQTTEIKAASEIIFRWLSRANPLKFGRQIFLITDPEKGDLGKLVRLENAKDSLSFRSLPLFVGVGGRYSEFNMGLLHLALLGVKLNSVLEGVQEMDKLCRKQNLWQNPALAYATLNFILGYKKGKVIALLMPFADALKSTADWYVQLLAESLGKKYLRKVRILPGGIETWQRDEKKLACVGRTPVACLGTTDLHSIQQNNVEGMNNKTVTFIRIEKFATDLHIPKGKEIVSGHSYAGLLKLAQEATEWSLTKECRPNCTISLDRLDGKNWAALLYFFQMATAYEGELLNVNAYDQPGVEGYKNYMHYKLGDPLVSKEFVKSVQKSAFKKNPNFILKT